MNAIRFSKHAVQGNPLTHCVSSKIVRRAARAVKRKRLQFCWETGKEENAGDFNPPEYPGLVPQLYPHHAARAGDTLYTTILLTGDHREIIGKNRVPPLLPTMTGLNVML